MKKPHFHVLITVTAVFAAFIIGFFLGRSYNQADILLTTSAAANSTSPATTTAEVTEQTTAPAVQTEQAVTQPAEAATLININTATVQELDTLPGIGPVIAQRIVDYRDTHGPFTSVAQLTNVSGIGNAKFAAIIDLITVE